MKEWKRFENLHFTTLTLIHTEHININININNDEKYYETKESAS